MLAFIKLHGVYVGFWLLVWILTGLATRVFLIQPILDEIAQTRVAVEDLR